MLQDISNALTINDKHLKPNAGAWIYAILVLLEKPLSPDCCFKLREFTKKCSDIRATLDNNTSIEDSLPFSLFICIISRFFNQLDLSD